MSRDDVFPNPTVKTVIFQIRYPSLFFIEKLIGEYQVNVMEQFPQSKLVVQRQFLFAQVQDDADQPEPPEEERAFPIRKVWQFIAPQGVTLSVHDQALSLVSEKHKTYRSPAAECRFRDLIEFSVDTFLQLTKLPVLSRIGLRYVDECPVPGTDSATFREYYETTLPLDRFPLSDATQMEFRTRIKRGQYSLLFKEEYKTDDDGPKLTLDFDGYAHDVKASGYLAVSDALHDLVSAEFFGLIKEPVIEYMRDRKE